MLDPLDGPRERATPLDLDFTVRLGEDVKLKGFGLDGAMTGRAEAGSGRPPAGPGVGGWAAPWVGAAAGSSGWARGGWVAQRLAVWRYCRFSRRAVMWGVGCRRAGGRKGAPRLDRTGRRRRFHRRAGVLAAPRLQHDRGGQDARLALDVAANQHHRAYYRIEYPHAVRPEFSPAGQMVVLTTAVEGATLEVIGAGTTAGRIQ